MALRVPSAGTRSFASHRLSSTKGFYVGESVRHPVSSGKNKLSATVVSAADKRQIRSVELFKTIARRWVGPRPRQAGGGFRTTPLAKFSLDSRYKNLPEASIHRHCVYLRLRNPAASAHPRATAASCAASRSMAAAIGSTRGASKRQPSTSPDGLPAGTI